MTPYILSILQGAVLVLEVALGSLVVAVVLGLMGAMAKLSGHKPAVWLATRCTPPSFAASPTWC